MTMSQGLEARVPFLDHELVELAAACPPDLKLAQGGKGVLKEASRRVIPSEVIDRPKGYFPVPALKHLEGPFLELVRDASTRPGGQESAGFSRRATSVSFSKRQTRTRPGSAATSCGRSGSWSCGYSRTASKLHLNLDRSVW